MRMASAIGGEALSAGARLGKRLARALSRQTGTRMILRPQPGVRRPEAGGSWRWTEDEERRMERGILRAVPSPQLVLDPLLPTGEFLSRLSHELRTPLNAVLGFAQLLELEGLEPQQTRQVGQILRGARHLLGLLNELLEISRIEAGTLRMALAPVPVAQLVREALASVERLGAERSVRFEADLDAHADLHVLADRQRLGQVVLSLLCNALGRSRDRGVVTIAAERHGDRVRLTVADNGATLGEEDLSRIFVPCERSAAAPAASGGSGLALALSRRYAELMRGSLSGTSRAGAGVALTLELALAAGLRLVADRTATLVLYVEDSDANYALAREILGRRGDIELVRAETGMRGLELALVHRPDVILLDLDLPDIPGHEVLARLQADPRTGQMPVVVLSAQATRSQVQRLLGVGAREYLTKPLDERQFLTVIDAQLPRAA